MNVAIIKYNAGNIYSVSYALKRLGVEAIVTADPEQLRKADKVIFPGVGEARTTMDYLREHQLGAIAHILYGGNTLLAQGIFDVDVKRFLPQTHTDKVPHMGWNTITALHSGLFDERQENQFVYFVHSYYVPVNPFTAATTDYILPFSAALHKDNFYATQFHPEKSGSVGEAILHNFLKL